MVIDEDTVRQALLLVRDTRQEIDDFLEEHPAMPRRVRMAIDNQRRCVYTLEKKLEEAVR